MYDSFDFAVQSVASALLGIMFWAACAGVGYRILPRSRTRSTGDPDEAAVAGPEDGTETASWRQAGTAACIGLGALVFLGGVGVLLEIPWWTFVVPFLVIGLVLAMMELRAVVDFKRVARSTLIIGGIGVGAFGVVALIEAPIGLKFPLNICDDWRAYLPMTHRLLDTYGLEEAWSARRLQNLGGFTFVQALPVAVFGNKGVGVAETMMASIFLAGLFVANGVRSVWARVLSVGLILSVPFLWVPRANSTGVLFGTPLLVVAFAVSVEVRASLRAGDRRSAMRWAVAAGLVIAALMSVRPNLGVLAALVLALGALSTTGTEVVARLRVLAAGAGAALVAVAPWSLASWRTSGTPLYPFFKGNLNADAVPKVGPNDVGDIIDRALDLASSGPYVSVTVCVVLVAFIAWKVLPDPVLLAIAGVSAALVTLAFAREGSALSLAAFARYTTPMSGGLAVFALCEVMRGVDGLPRRVPRTSRPRAFRAAAVVATVGIAVVAFADLGFQDEFPALPAGWNLIRQTEEGRLQPPPGLEVSTPALQRTFDRAMRSVDADRTIVAVDRPYLIDYSRYDVPNLDAPGVVAPDGNFPMYRSPVSKIERLQQAGFDTLVATDPVHDACLTPVRIYPLLVGGVFRRARYRGTLDWDQDIATIARDAPKAVRRVGALLVIDLPRARRELAAAR